MDYSVVAVREQRGINHCWICAEQHPFFQAVVIDTGHERALFRRSCLFFNDGSHSYDSVEVTIEADRFRLLAEVPGHHGEHVSERLRTSEVIGIGKEISLKRLRCRVQIAD